MAVRRERSVTLEHPRRDEQLDRMLVLAYLYDVRRRLRKSADERERSLPEPSERPLRCDDVDLQDSAQDLGTGQLPAAIETYPLDANGRPSSGPMTRL